MVYFSDDRYLVLLSKLNTKLSCTSCFEGSAQERYRTAHRLPTLFLESAGDLLPSCERLGSLQGPLQFWKNPALSREALERVLRKQFGQ